MNALQNALNGLVAKTYALTVLTHIAHWNVVGERFFELHAAFGSQYEELFDAVDTLAEQLRAIGGNPLTDVSEFVIALGNLPMLKKASDPVPELIAAHEDILADINAAVELSTKDLATQNILLDRVNAHQKVVWMLNSTMESED